MARYFIHLSYWGKNFHGWQIQENEQNTVQHRIEEALALLLKTPAGITGCGRTDTGVNASEYFAHFDSISTIDSTALNQLHYKLNKILPEDIAIKQLFRVPDEAHARFDALSRTYEYRIHQLKDPFKSQFSLYHYGALNIQHMNEAAQLLLQTSDFSSFSKAHTQVSNNICKVTQAQWTQPEAHNLYFIITANRFLRNMVRALVGTLLELGMGKINLDEFKKIISSKNRSNAGFSAPAHALYLSQITYPSSIFQFRE